VRQSRSIRSGGPREKQINFRVTPEEDARFLRLAQHYGIPVAAMLRMLVKRDADLLFGADGAGGE